MYDSDSDCEMTMVVQGSDEDSDFIDDSQKQEVVDLLMRSQRDNEPTSTVANATCSQLNADSRTSTTSSQALNYTQLVRTSGSRISDVQERRPSANQQASCFSSLSQILGCCDNDSVPDARESVHVPSSMTLQRGGHSGHIAGSVNKYQDVEYELVNVFESRGN